MTEDIFVTFISACPGLMSRSVRGRCGTRNTAFLSRVYATAHENAPTVSVAGRCPPYFTRRQGQPQRKWTSVALFLPCVCWRIFATLTSAQFTARMPTEGWREVPSSRCRQPQAPTRTKRLGCSPSCASMCLGMRLQPRIVRLSLHELLATCGTVPQRCSDGGGGLFCRRGRCFDMRVFVYQETCAQRTGTTLTGTSHESRAQDARAYP